MHYANAVLTPTVTGKATTVEAKCRYKHSCGYSSYHFFTNLRCIAKVYKPAEYLIQIFSKQGCLWPQEC